MPTLEFIYAVLIHTSSKNFKVVRKYELYSRRSSYYQLAKLYLPAKLPNSTNSFEFKNNILNFSEVNPFICEDCHFELVLYSISYFDSFGELKTILFEDNLYNDYSYKEGP